MIVRTVLKQKGDHVITVAPTDSIADVSRVLTENRIGAVPVRDARGALVGILSERDIVRTLAERGGSCLELQAADLMAQKVVTGTPNDSIDQIMVLMTEHRFRHLPIMENDAFVGIISIGDVVKARIAEIELERDAMKQYIATG